MSQATVSRDAPRAGPAPKTLLSIRGVETFYGKIQALKGVDIEVSEGEIVTLIGANGAGKSTMMMTIFGKPRARSGSITFDGQEITNMPTHKIARMSIAQSPEGRRIFPRMTVFENLQMGASIDNFAHFEDDLEQVFAMFPRLKERGQQRGGTLSGGEQQMLAIARALMMRPKLLLLDEPSFGLAPIVVAEIFRILRAINQSEGVGMLIVEQNANLALELADHAYLIETGRVAMGGPAARLRDDETVRRVYLGY